MKETVINVPNAFPSTQVTPSKFANQAPIVQHNDGMSLFDYFAAHAPAMPAQLMNYYTALSEQMDGQWDNVAYRDQYLSGLAQWRFDYAMAMCGGRESFIMQQSDDVPASSIELIK